MDVAKLLENGFPFEPSRIVSRFLRLNSTGKHYDHLRPPNFMLQYKRPKGEDLKWMKWRNLHFLKKTQSISFRVSEMKPENTK